MVLLVLADFVLPRNLVARLERTPRIEDEDYDLGHLASNRPAVIVKPVHSMSP